MIEKSGRSGAGSARFGSAAERLPSKTMTSPSALPGIAPALPVRKT